MFDDLGNGPAPITPLVVFSDFDGTITACETFSVMLRRFTPELTERLVPELYAGRISLRDGIRQLIESIPSARYPEILDQVEEAGLRPGLPELLDLLDQHQVPFVVVSGGLRGMVERALGPLITRTRAIHAMDVDTTGPHLRVASPFETATEIVAKPEVMKLYPAEQRIALGDAITDVSMALAADVVYARDWLADHLRTLGHPYRPWNDFHDVKKDLGRIWGRS